MMAMLVFVIINLVIFALGMIVKWIDYTKKGGRSRKRK